MVHRLSRPTRQPPTAVMLPASTRGRPLLFALTFLTCVPPAGAAAHLVVDLDTGPPQDALYETLNGVEHDGVSYFQGNDPQHGQELWRTDGTAPGTFRLTDVCPGTCDSGATPLAFVSGFLLFVAFDGDRQNELWRTDGVPGHESLVKELCPGLCSLAVQDSLVWNGKLWIIVHQPGSAPTLWRSDATPGGTEQMADLCADLVVCNFGQGSAWFAGVTAGGDALVLIAGTDRADILLRTDGTRQGTTRLHRSPNLQITSNRTQTAVLQGAGIASEPPGALYFVDGSQLWISDGTVEGTRFVRDLATLVPLTATDLQTWRTFDGIFYAITGQGVWLRSDGTSSGTVLLGNLSTIFAAAICRLGSTIYAVADDGLWTTGASPQVPQLIAPLSLDYFEQVVEQPDRIYIENLADVYLSDGTTAGTHRLRMAENAVDEYTLTPLFDGASFASGLNTLWRIDGDSDSISLLRDFEPANGSAGPYGQAVLNDRLIFFAFTEIGSFFASDGTEAGTQVVSAAVNAFGFDRNDQPFSRIGGHLFFPAVPGLWETDGTASGTRSLTPFVNYQRLYYEVPIAAIGDRLLFEAVPYSEFGCPNLDTEPWISDGTRAGTHEVVDLNPFYGPGGGSLCDDLPLGSDPGPGVSLGSTALFAADDLVHGREPFVTDGTAAGTHLLADINPGTMPNDVTEDGNPPRIGVDSNPTDFTRYGSGAFFVADDGSTGRQLWFTTGKRSGTHRLTANGVGPFAAAPHDLVTFRGELYFIASYHQGEALFRSDSTNEGTLLVDDLTLGGQPSIAHALTVADDQLFFVAFNETTGSELWVSSGTAGSTHLVVDLRPGPVGSAPQELTAVGRLLVFAADDGTAGLEPWRSDGTAAGTFLLADIAVGLAASNPGPFNVVGQQILFGADDGIHGRELWAMPLGDLRPRRRAGGTSDVPADAESSRPRPHQPSRASAGRTAPPEALPPARGCEDRARVGEGAEQHPRGRSAVRHCRRPAPRSSRELSLALGVVQVSDRHA